MATDQPRLAQRSQSENYVSAQSSGLSRLAKSSSALDALACCRGCRCGWGLAGQQGPHLPTNDTTEVYGESCCGTATTELVVSQLSAATACKRQQTFEGTPSRAHEPP